MFIDEVVIRVKSGKGGNGMVHFRREKYEPRGGPDGGDGGKGGDLILEVSPTLNTLSPFRHQTHYEAPSGGNGARSNMTGRSGKDLVLLVPPGTLVYDRKSGELLGDLTEPAQQLTIVSGGRGGRGNARFATSRDQAPRIAEKGEPAQEKELRLELKLIADVGIVGLPNAGKSTLLSTSTNAKPKIAPYPFTTIEPNLGVAYLDEETSLVLADIPGLIEGAHMGIGLGHDFLRHIQRTRVLIHLLDGLSEDPLSDFAQINTELSLFDAELATKPQVVAFNKMDLTEVQERWPEIQQQLIKRAHLKKEDVFAVSAATGEGVRDLLYRAEARLIETPEMPVTEAVPVYRPETDPNQFSISRTPEGWRVSGVAIERAAQMTYWEYDASVRRFQKILHALGVDDALRKAGVVEGDIVCIGDFELEWTD
jgi:GTP-binding protein